MNNRTYILSALILIGGMLFSSDIVTIVSPFGWEHKNKVTKAMDFYSSEDFPVSIREDGIILIPTDKFNFITNDQLRNRNIYLPNYKRSLHIENGSYIIDTKEFEKTVIILDNDQHKIDLEHGDVVFNSYNDDDLTVYAPISGYFGLFAEDDYSSFCYVYGKINSVYMSSFKNNTFESELNVEHGDKLGLSRNSTISYSIWDNTKDVKSSNILAIVINVKALDILE